MENKEEKTFVIKDIELFKRQLENLGDFGLVSVTDVLTLLNKYLKKER